MRKVSEFGGNPTLRMEVKKAGPVVTENGTSFLLNFYSPFIHFILRLGNFIVDADFGTIEDPHTLNEKLLRIVLLIYSLYA